MEWPAHPPLVGGGGVSILNQNLYKINKSHRSFRLMVHSNQLLATSDIKNTGAHMHTSL